MPIQKFRSVEAMEDLTWVKPGTPEHSRALQAVFVLVARFAPQRRFPPGVFTFRSVEEADAQREVWERSCD